MVVRMADPESETSSLIDRARAGDSSAWGVLMERYRDRLRRMVALRMDRRLQGRLDASDVIQEAMLEASHQ
jgi:RNA polymerase sigma-70 factor, ECF subfamily